MISTNEVQIWYLFHSGYAVKTSSHFLIFDYYCPKNTPFSGMLSEGLIDPLTLKDEHVIAFASHAHADHFDKRIMEWSDTIENIQYILSDDIKHLDQYQGCSIMPVHFSKTYELDDMTIHTLHSTDAGVAFLVETDGITIYHSGDLNWWHWNGETKHYNDTMAGQYRHEIDLLKEKKIDLGFVPLDPRLEDKYILGLDYFAKHTQTKAIFPMHFFNHTSVLKKLEQEPLADSYRNRIYIPNHRGFQFLYQAKDRE